MGRRTGERKSRRDLAVASGHQAAGQPGDVSRPGVVAQRVRFGRPLSQREAIGRQIAARQTANPRDAWASVKQAEIAILHHDPGQGAGFP